MNSIDPKYNLDEMLRGQLHDAEAAFTPEERDMDWQSVQSAIPPPVNGLSPWIKGMFGAAIGGCLLLAIMQLYPSKTKDTNDAAHTSADLSLIIPEKEQTGYKPLTKIQKEEIIEETISVELSKIPIQEANPSNSGMVTVEPLIPEKKTAASPRPEVNKGKQAKISPEITANLLINDIDVPPSLYELSKLGTSQGTPEPVIIEEEQLKLNPAEICDGDSVFLTLPKSNTDTEYKLLQLKGYPKNITSDTSWIVKGQGQHVYTIIRITESGIDTIQLKVNVSANPVANFSLETNDLPRVQARDLSYLAYSYQWDFGDGEGKYYSPEPLHSYNDTGTYLVSLEVSCRNGCIHKKEKQLNVRAETIVKIPNVITPNGDNLNDFFLIQINGEKFYDLTIVDASGRAVFRSNDKQVLWDGNHYRGGQPLPPGTYFYVFRYHLIGQPAAVTKTGTITMIKE